jgi:hypothetical protein
VAARGPTLRRGVLVGLAALMALLPLFALRGFLLAGSPAAIARRLYGLNPFPESIGIGSYIQRTSLPEDRVFIVGSEPQILFYAARRSATRYIFFYPLTGDFPDARARQQEVVDAVEAAASMSFGPTFRPRWREPEQRAARLRRHLGSAEARLSARIRGAPSERLRDLRIRLRHAGASLGTRSAREVEYAAVDRHLPARAARAAPRSQRRARPREFPCIVFPLRPRACSCSR